MVLRVLVVAIVAVTRPAIVSAEPSWTEAADRLFAEGQELKKQSRFEEACATFEESQRLDPQFGTMFNLASCKLAARKLLTAWSLFRQIARSDDTDAQRRQRSADLAAEIERRIPKLLVNFVDAPAGARVKLGKVDITSLVGFELPIDVGVYELVGTAPGFAPWRKSIAIVEDQTVVKANVELQRGAEPAAPRREEPGGPGIAWLSRLRVAVAGGETVNSIGLGVRGELDVATVGRWRFPAVVSVISQEHPEKDSDASVSAGVSVAVITRPVRVSLGAGAGFVRTANRFTTQLVYSPMLELPIRASYPLSPQWSLAGGAIVSWYLQDVLDSAELAIGRRGIVVAGHVGFERAL